MSFKQFLLIILARWRIAAGIFAAVLVIGVVYLLLSTKLYTASATVVVDFRSDPIAGGVAGQTQFTSSYIATQVDIISSQRVAQRVVKILKLDKSPQFADQWKEGGGHGDFVVWLGSKLQRKVAVTPSRDSSVIDIAVEWTDGKTAAVLANAFAQAYIDTTIELRVDPAKQYAAWFDERSQALRLDLQAKQKKLTDFQTETGVIAGEGRLDIENARLAELSSQLVTIQGMRQDSQSRQHQLTGGDSDSMTEVLQNPVIANLKGDLARAEAKLQDIGSSLGKNHPDYQTTAAEVAGLKARIYAETQRIGASLGNTTQINLRRESDIRQALEAQKKRILELSHGHDQAAVLQNDVATAQRNLDAVTQRLAQTSLESQTQQTNIALLTPAVEPLLRSSPRYGLGLGITLFLGTLLGLAGAMAVELSDKRVREGTDLAGLPGIPVLARIPRIKTEGRSDRGSSPPSARLEPSAI